MMKKQDILNCVVFIARKYGGEKLGAERHTMYVEAAKGAIEACGIPISAHDNAPTPPPPYRTVPPLT